MSACADARPAQAQAATTATTTTTTHNYVPVRFSITIDDKQLADFLLWDLDSLRHTALAHSLVVPDTTPHTQQAMAHQPSR